MEHRPCLMEPSDKKEGYMWQKLVPLAALVIENVVKLVRRLRKRREARRRAKEQNSKPE